jgi:hypothetical protein
MARDPLHERIAGNLMAAALGDALGTPTEGCSRAEITQRYGGLVRGFQPCAVEASAVGAVGLRPGEVTDDTSQLLAVARALIACDGELDAARWTAVLRDWLLTSPKARLAGRRPGAYCTAGRNIRLDGSTTRRWVRRTAPRCGWRRRVGLPGRCRARRRIGVSVLPADPRHPGRRGCRRCHRWRRRGGADKPRGSWGRIMPTGRAPASATVAHGCSGGRGTRRWAAARPGSPPSRRRGGRDGYAR